MNNLSIASRTFAVIVTALLLVANAASAATLQKHSVDADGHALRLWEKSAGNATEAILLVHGRTWSALPDFDLQVDGEDLSLMDGLVAQGYAVYAVDLRGYGETLRDETGWLTPFRAADDVAIVLEWIAAQRDWEKPPHLFGWSMGSTISQLAVQRHPGRVASLTLFGYWRNLDEPIPAVPGPAEPLREINTAAAAASDFIVPGSISQRAIDAYVEQALAADPVRVDVLHPEQYNALDPELIKVPTLVIHGEFDPLTPIDQQAALFTRLGTAHKQWIVVPGGDHAAFLEAPRDYFLYSLGAFLESTAY